MTKFVDSVNKYLTEMQIKNSFVSLKSGIPTKKLTNILSKKQEITVSEMEKIANALGEKTEFFLTENFTVSSNITSTAGAPVFYAGEPQKEQTEFVIQFLELIENVDEILSAEDYYMMAAGTL